MISRIQYSINIPVTIQCLNDFLTTLPPRDLVLFNSLQSASEMLIINSFFLPLCGSVYVCNYVNYILLSSTNLYCIEYQYQYMGLDSGFHQEL